jgi:MFS family permease
MSKFLILTTSVIVGMCRTFDTPALQSILPDIVPKDMLPKAIASSASAMQIASIVAPALGGLLYTYGANVTYILTCSVYILGIVFVILLPKLINQNAGNPITLKNMLAGVHYIYNNKDVLGAISLDLFVVLLGGATALLPIFANEILHTDTFGLGVLRSAPAIGALIMSIVLAKYQITHKVGKTMFIAVSVFGIATIIFGLSSSFILSFISLLVVGASDVISVIIRTSFIQLQTPSEMRGRVNAVNSLFIGASNQLGEFESGVTAEIFGARLSVILGGMGTLAIVALWIKWFPSLVERDKF